MQDEIKQALDDVCKYVLPSSLKPACLVLVNRYADEIIRELINGIDPTQVCRLIGFCDAIAASKLHSLS